MKMSVYVGQETLVYRMTEVQAVSFAKALEKFLPDAGWEVSVNDACNCNANHVCRDCVGRYE